MVHHVALVALVGSRACIFKALEQFASLFALPVGFSSPEERHYLTRTNLKMLALQVVLVSALATAANTLPGVRGGSLFSPCFVIRMAVLRVHSLAAPEGKPKGPNYWFSLYVSVAVYITCSSDR